MNARHYEIAKRLLQRLQSETNAIYQDHKAKAGGSAEAGKAALAHAVAKIGSESDEWCAQAFAGETLPLDLSGADLRGSMFVGGRVWMGADLSNAQLDGSQWFFAHVENADFTGASLHQAFAMSLCCDGTRFHEADLFGATLYLYAQTEPVDLSHARLGAATVFLDYPSRYVLTGAIMGCSVRCTDVTAGTRKAYDLFWGALSEEQKREVTMGVTPQDLAKSDQLAATLAAGGATPKSGGCFIATACCGSPQDPLVQDLRQFRDDVLLASGAGRAIAAAYAHASPPLADWIRKRAWARSLGRHMLVRPFAWAVRTARHK